MNRLALFVIRRATPPADREWVIGDTVEEYEARVRADGPAAARRWLMREALRVLRWAPQHRLVIDRRGQRQGAGTTGDGAMRILFDDLRHAGRLLRRSPAFTTVSIVTLALGIGVNTAMFAAVNGVLLKPLPFPNADRLMLVHMLVPDRERPGVFGEHVWSYPKYRTIVDTARVFDELALFSSVSLELGGDGEPEPVRGEVVTDRYPSVVGLLPLLGRAFTPEESAKPGATAVTMISEGLWRRRFAADPAVLGRTIDINRLPHSVVGVLPRGFRGLSGNADVWVPLAVHEPSQLTQGMSHSYYLVARRRPDVSEGEAQAAVQALGPEIDRLHPRSEGGPAWGARAVSLSDSRADADVRRGSMVLLGAVGFVLLIGCVNLTNLVAARSLSRRREVAVRVALGASRSRIVRQFVAEGALLAAGGAVAGLAVAAVMLAAASIVLPDADVFFRTAVAPGTPRTAGAAGLTRIGAAMIGLDGATLLFTGGVATLTALLVSLLPAAQASMLRPVEALKAGASASNLRRSDVVLRGGLVTAQIALAVILLAGASLMVRSARHLRGTEIGVTHENIMTARVFLPRSTYTAASGGALFDQLTARVRALPGVESVGLGSCPPVSGGCSSSIIWFPPAKFRGGGQDPGVDIHWVTPEYFATLGIGLKAGRLFSEFDRPGQPEVLIVNEHAARTLWPNDTPIGKRAMVGMGSLGNDGGVIVGVVSDVRYRSIESVAGAAVYLPLAQSYQPGMRLFVRSALDPAALTGAIAQEVRALDPSLPISEIKTMRQRLGDAMWRTRVSAGLLTGLAALALMLTAIGIFGVMAQTVTQRTSEIGVRIALGAQSRDVAALVLRNIATITAMGIAIGIAGALGLTRLIASMLYGVTPGDPLTMVAVVAMLAIVAVAAGYLPVRRATRVDAIAALKSE